jgi:hypothetical protein
MLSNYAVYALRKFVVEVDGISGRWTWQQCIEFAIQAMHDIGLEAILNWRTLALALAWKDVM